MFQQYWRTVSQLEFASSPATSGVDRSVQQNGSLTSAPPLGWCQSVPVQRLFPCAKFTYFQHFGLKQRLRRFCAVVTNKCNETKSRSNLLLKDLNRFNAAASLFLSMLWHGGVSFSVTAAQQEKKNLYFLYPALISRRVCDVLVFCEIIVLYYAPYDDGLYHGTDPLLHVVIVRKRKWNCE